MPRRVLVLFLLNASCWIALAGCLQTIEPGEWVGDDTRPKPKDCGKAEGLSALQETVIQLCYEMLDVKRDASLSEVKEARRKLVLKYHPDKKPEIADVFSAIKEACDILKMYVGTGDIPTTQDCERVVQQLEHALALKKAEPMRTSPPVKNDVAVDSTTQTTLDDID